MTKEIQQAIIKNYYLSGHPYCCTNFAGYGYCEADVFTVNKNRYVNEFEVKISRSDFKADLKKVNKHKQLSREVENSQFHRTPNRFYYVCPDGLILITEIPFYAGLIYYKNGLLIEIKPAPLIHKIKCDDNLILKICSVLSARAALGCSLMTYRNRDIQNAFNNK